VTLGVVQEAQQAGAKLTKACEVVGISARSVQRWRKQGGGEDGRKGPRREPANKFSAEERQRVLEVVNNAEYRELSPKQIVPRLADRGVYLGSESTLYRLLRSQGQMAHRESSRPAGGRRPRQQVATGPCQVWSWDITYLRSSVRGLFFYLYLMVDVWSRKIVGWQVEELESMEVASELIEKVCIRLGVDPEGLVLHSDNGGPMKGSTMLATLQRLGIMPSFSRPRVNDDNPYSEALFRTLKYRPEYPGQPFASVEAARTWVAWFVNWYNTEHLHSAIRFVTPDDRHYGAESQILKRRRWVYEQARKDHPDRWSGAIRNWEPIGTVYLNPEWAEAEDEGAEKKQAA